MDDAAKRLIYERNGVRAPQAGPRTGFAGSFADPEARRIIAERNGLGRTPQLAPDDADRLARMRTDKQARAVLGAVAQVLQTAYTERLPIIARLTSAGQQLQAAMKSRLDGINNYAQRVYATIPDDDAPVAAQLRDKVALVLAQAHDAAQDIDEAVQSQHLDVGQGLVDVLKYLVEQALGGVGGLLTPTGMPKWVKIAVGGVVVLLVGTVVTKVVRSVMLGRVALGEAEEAAVAIAEAGRQRKLRRKTVLSIS